MQFVGMACWQARKEWGELLYCPKCGSEISEAAEYCKICGCRVKGGEGESAPVEPAAIKRNIRAKGGNGYKRTRKGRKRGHPVLTFLLVLLLIGLVFAVAWFYINKKAQEIQMDRVAITSSLELYGSAIAAMDANAALEKCTPEYRAAFKGADEDELVFLMIPNNESIGNAARFAAVWLRTFHYSLEFEESDIKMNKDSADVEADVSWSVTVALDIASSKCKEVFHLERLEEGWRIDSIKIIAPPAADPYTDSSLPGV
ncbi:MAG: zinc ribbon domain-containing protein [Clostridiales bacterium]|nr:zinc ribbon domain-containing protein [Clostridiales bacterium]